MMQSSSSSSRMLKLILGKGNQPSAERTRLQKELFQFNKELRHGFPNKPTSMAWDPKLKLLAIATKQGALRIYGQPGVEHHAEHENLDSAITKMLFLSGGAARLVTLSEDNILHLWEINGTKLEVKGETGLDGRLKKISVLCVDGAGERLLLGTEGGNIYQLNLAKFCIEEAIIYQDLVMKGAPDDFKVNPGAVEALLTQPLDPHRLLIGYARGLIVLWDTRSNTAVQTFVASQQLESLAWRGDGSQFVSAHNDGSYVVWSSQGLEPLEPPNAPYGPYPCKAINKVLWAHDNGDAWLVFGGGMPRASYGDKATVTVMQGDDKHVVFDLTSKIIDFELLRSEAGAPHTLLILAEEELVAVDLSTPDTWPVHAAPYLNSIHASAVTCVAHAHDVNEEVYAQLTHAEGSDKPWPVSGGTVEANDAVEKHNEVLITGHEDGSVKVWACEGGVSLRMLTTVKTNKFFMGDELDEPPPEDEEEEEDEWPPFRKVGHYDPYSDDPRLAVKKVYFCPSTGRLVCGGTAGQVVVLDLAPEAAETPLKLVKQDLVTEKDGFTWKAHAALSLRAGDIKMVKGYQPKVLLQISPPASINSLSCHQEWGLVAAGTAHGLVVLDAVQDAVILSKCTLNAQEIANADDNPLSRRKSLKKSLRESFRRLRKGRSQRNIDKKRPGAPAADPIKKDIRSESPDSSRPVERQIEARSGSEDGHPSMVRCLHFANTFIANPATVSRTLWAGTNSGQILVFLLHIPAGEKRATDKASSMLGKEIQLKHKAPVISIDVLDAAGTPVTSSKDALTAPHRVLIASEEQFKSFLLPTLKPCGKYKLTAHEGSRIRRVAFNTFVSKSDAGHAENCFVCLTNQGSLAVHSLPDLRRQASADCVKKDDIIAVSTLVFTPRGEALYMCSSSELQRVSVAARPVVRAKGTVAHLEGSRPEPKREVEEVKKPLPVISVSPAADATPPTQQASSSMDPHNDTTVSEISADITMDSVKDHTMSQAAASALASSSNLNNVTLNESVTTTSSTTTTSDGVTKVTTTSVIKSGGVVEKTEETVVTKEVNGEKEVVKVEEKEDLNEVLSSALEAATINEFETTIKEQVVESKSSSYFSQQKNEQFILQSDSSAPLASMESAGSEFPSMMSTMSEVVTSSSSMTSDVVTNMMMPPPQTSEDASEENKLSPNDSEVEEEEEEDTTMTEKEQKNVE